MLKGRADEAMGRATMGVMRRKVRRKDMVVVVVVVDGMEGVLVARSGG